MKTPTLLRKQVRVDGLHEDVDSARLVAAKDPPRLGRRRGQEDDRHGAGARGAAHQLGQLEAAHVGHLDVDDGDRDVVPEEEIEGLPASRGLEHAHAGLASASSPTRLSATSPTARTSTSGAGWGGGASDGTGALTRCRQAERAPESIPLIAKSKIW